MYWACIDCGVNTFPGCPSKGEIERHFNEHCEVYHIHPSVWWAAGMEPMGGCLCIGCLEKRLGRRLRPRDFERRHPFNSLPGTERLIDRRGS